MAEDDKVKLNASDAKKALESAKTKLKFLITFTRLIASGGLIFMLLAFVWSISVLFTADWWLAMALCMIYFGLFSIGMLAIELPAIKALPSVIVMAQLRLITALDFWFKFASRFTGRGVLYITQGFLATQSLAQYHSGFGYAVGWYFFLLGILYVILGYIVSSDIFDLKQRIKTHHEEQEYDKIFKKYAKEIPGDGEEGNRLVIQKAQLSKLCDEMGASFSSGELDMMLQMLDTDSNGEIDQEEFLVWYESQGMSII